MTISRKNGYWLDLGRIGYLPAFDIQERLIKARMEGRVQSVVILQENDPVFTIGRSGSRDNILTSSEELERWGIEVLEVNRGGDVTYHGPGQLIVSCLFYLGDLDLNANQYLHSLEDVLMNFLSLYGIETTKKPDYPGVWVKDSKIGAVGIAVKHGHTFHGFAVNANLDLSPYELINPCGVSRMPIVSLNQVLNQPVDMSEVKKELKTIIENMFSLDLADATWSDLKAGLNEPVPEERTAETQLDAVS